MPERCDLRTLSGMDATRALLDALMGPNRNEKGAKTSASGQPDWEDKTICKHFLVGSARGAKKSALVIGCLWLG
eukprot:2270549-Amphidinium_carterae.1